ncbi:MAG: hypothetical protein MH204_08585 [Fimbriimonadaceae bacterium]|nr:hypothetical protein [Fimbriimonadaceae bacterium]
MLEFEAAGHARFEDGFCLAMIRRQAGGVYLMGYQAEIRLKIACLKASGLWRPNMLDREALTRLKRVATDRDWFDPSTKTIAWEDQRIKCRSFHSLEFWAVYLAHALMEGEPQTDRLPQLTNMIQVARDLDLFWHPENRYHEFVQCTALDFVRAWSDLENHLTWLES